MHSHHKSTRSLASPKSTGKQSTVPSEVKTKKKKVSTKFASATADRPSSPLRSGIKAANAEATHSASVHTAEEVLYDQLVALKTILLKSSSSRTFHDFSLLQGHIHTRAVAAVEDELRQISARLLQLRGPSANHRITAYTQLLASLTHDIEAAVFNVDRRAVSNMQNDQLAAKIETQQQQASWNEKLARKDQTILSLQSEHATMDFKNKSLIRTVELLSKELEKCNANLTNVHQRSVEVRMQAIDFKAEVDKRAQRVLQSVQARVGFVPETIQKHLSQLTALLPPGDANYDKVRMELYKKSAAGAPSGSGSAPGTPTSTSRKAMAMMAAGLQLQLNPANTTSSPRSSFTSSSPTSTTASGANSPPRGFERAPASATRAAYAPATGASGAESGVPGIAMTATPSTVASASIPSNWTPASIDTSGLHINTRSTVGADAATATTSTVRSQLSPTNKTAERRQMLITSLFPRASFSVQDSTGIADITFPNMEPEQAERVNARATVQPASSAQRAPAAASRAMPPGHRYPTEVPLQESDVDYDDSEDEGSANPNADNSDDEGSANPNADSLDEDEPEEDESDDDDSGDEEDAGETRTNPSASQQSFSSSSSCSDGQEADSTSVGADDELPVGHAHSHVHPHAHASAGTHAQGTSSHYLPRVTAQHSPAREGKRTGGNSESDEGGDFYENMKKFLQGFQESQLIDVSDSEMDPDGRIKMIAHNTAATALQAKRRAASNPAKAPIAGASKGKGKAARKSGRVVTAGIAEAKSTPRSSW